MKKNILYSLFLLLLINSTMTATTATANKKGGNMQNSNIYFVILAGGSGTRLWPLSRADKPKQFLAVGSNKTLIDQAIDRICDIAPQENIWISTTAKHVENINTYVGHRIGNIVVEPGMRNTAPAILLACLEIQKVNPNASIIFLPSDPFIPNKEKFVSYVQQAIEFIEQNNKITLFGIQPTYPATGYGYIEFDNTKSKSAPYPVLKFHEKPKLELAQKYVKKDNMAWNMGMFCAKVDVFVQEFKTHAPEIFQGVTDCVHGNGDYNTVKADSIDYAVMEKSSNTYVIPADFPWCDVGNIEVFLTIEQQNGQLKNNTLSVDSQNNLVKVKDKLVALVCVDNLCVVETDDILLITQRDKAEQVKQIVQQLKDSNNTEYL